MEFSAMLAEARPNVPKSNTKIEYCVRSVRAGNTAPMAIGDQHSRKPWTLAAIFVEARNQMKFLLTTLLLLLGHALCGQKSLHELQLNTEFKWILDSLSPRLTIYYQSSNTISSKIEKVRDIILSQLDSVEKFMRIESYKSKIHLFVVDSRKQMKRLIGWETNGTGFYKENIATGIESEKTRSIYSAHEYFHLMAMNLWGLPERWINEGMAVYADDKWQGYDLHELTKYLIDNGRYVQLRRLIKNMNRENSSISYPLIGSFVKHLDETYGRELILKIWRGKTRDLEKITKMSLAELESDWLTKLKQVNYSNIKY